MHKMTCCCRKSNLVCFQAMHCLSASYHCVQLIIALLVPFQTARLSFKSTAMQFQLFLLTCIVSRPQHYLPKLLMSTAYLSIYDGIILSPPRTLPDNRRYLRLWIGFIIRFIACLSSTLNKTCEVKALILTSKWMLIAENIKTHRNVYTYAVLVFAVYTIYLSKSCFDSTFPWVSHKLLYAMLQCTQTATAFPTVNL